MGKKILKVNTNTNFFKYPDYYGEWLGYRVTKLDPKKREAHTELKLLDKHLSQARRVHGGVVSGFLDYTCGAAVFSTLSPNDYCSTVEIKVNYFKPLFSGDHLKAVARVVYRGNRLCSIQAFLYKKKEKEPVGMATATFNIVISKSDK